MSEATQSTKREDRRERFRRLAEKRVVQTIKDIRLIGNLANRNNYEYDQDDIDKIFRALDREIKQSRAAFDKDGKQRDIEFSL